ncbi:hypothetical protein KUV51_16690 [Tateyamaria omphalii]|uniref:CAP domain-containing protein n=1 Tax=Tateyamaria omphalii TaxID=299262 RepID=UPI001C99B4DA|nr:CAP domain-containing protein [Tateyamaria omphalii]MBY5934647.1 hypothetical protein [Tateyamaria omphalii]
MSVASEFERLMLDLINEERTSRGLDPLTLELRLNDASEDHSVWMDDTLNFSHTGVGNSDPGDRMRDAGFVFSGNWTWGENIAYQSERGEPGIADDVEDLHQSLMNSPGHRANILNPDFDLIGIGIEVGDNRGFDAVYVTQKFASTSAPVQLDIEDSNTPDPEPGATNGNDVLLGGNGSDRLDGLAGNDTLDGSGGADRLFGGAGNDVVRGDSGNDFVGGDAGNDRLSGGGGDDRVKGGDGNDVVIGASGNDMLTGNEGNDSVYGGSGNDTLDAGGGGRNRLDGEGGNDRLIGGNGRDRMDGGAGNDTLTGGGGNDIFLFSEGRDIVTDFDISQSDETIDLRHVASITSFQDLMSGGHLTQSGRHAVIDDLNGNTMIIMRTDIADFQADDFLF